jgi:hypothetical protein
MRNSAARTLRCISNTNWRATGRCWTCVSTQSCRMAGTRASASTRFSTTVSAWISPLNRRLSYDRSQLMRSRWTGSAASRSRNNGARRAGQTSGCTPVLLPATDANRARAATATCTCCAGKAWRARRLGPYPAEIGVRHAEVDWRDTPADRMQRELTLVANLFLDGHNNKITAEISRLSLDYDGAADRADNRWRVQWDVSF